MGIEADAATMARTFAYLFGFGAVLLLITLYLPGSLHRDEEALRLVAFVAIGVSAIFMIGFDRLPRALFEAAPSLGTVLVGLVIYYGGRSSTAPYALYLAWVVISAACFFSAPLTILHGTLAVVVYAAAVHLAGGSSTPLGLQLTMTAGTAIVAAGIIGGINRELREVTNRLGTAARTDPLTGLYNRRELEQGFERELARAARSGQAIGLVLIDLDHFKEFNDAHGHPAGDEMLCRLAAALDDSTRAIDVVARIGGEEFAVLTPATDIGGALVVAERVRRAVEVRLSDGLDALTASCGVAAFPRDGKSYREVMRAADVALYKAKRMGRNCVVGAPDRGLDVLRIGEAGPPFARRRT